MAASGVWTSETCSANYVSLSTPDVVSLSWHRRSVFACFPSFFLLLFFHFYLMCMVFLNFIIIIIYFICMVFLLFACLYTTCMSGAHGNWNRALDPLQLGVTDSCAPPCGCWELDLGTLENQTVCLAAEPSLQPLRGDVLKSRPYPQFSLLQLDEFDAGIYKFYLMQIFL